MVTRRQAVIFLGIAGLACLEACTTARARFYPGEALAPYKVALLTVGPVEAFKPLPIIWYVDGKAIERHTIQTGLVGPVDVEVLPGPHTVQLGYYQRKAGPPTLPTLSRFSGKDSYVIDVEAEAGRTYEARVRVLSEDTSGVFWEAEKVVGRSMHATEICLPWYRRGPTI